MTSPPFAHRQTKEIPTYFTWLLRQLVKYLIVLWDVQIKVSGKG